MMSEELIDDIINKEKTVYELAEKPTRFWNYCIDFIVILFLNIVLGLACGTFGIDIPFGFISLCIRAYLIGLFYYVLMEFLTGKTIGKYITKTKVINTEGSPIAIETSLIRNLCRLIPFNALFFLFSSSIWHDSISKTYVVKDEGL